MGRMAMSVEVTEQAILEALHEVPHERWSQVLDLLHRLRPTASQSHPKSEPTPHSIAELRAMPASERDAILATQAALVEADYRNDSDLTDFTAFGSDDLHVDDDDSRTR